MIHTLVGVVIGGGIGVIIGQFLKALREYARPDGKKSTIDISTEELSFYGHYRGDGRGTYNYTITPIETPQTPPTGEQEIGENK
jgi:hypothetical protein